jgi:hypothetical protein
MEEHRMRKGFRLVLCSVFVFILVLSASCSPSPAGSAGGAEPVEPEVEEPTAVIAEEGEELTDVEETEAPVEEAGTGGEVPVSENGVPVDIPVPEEAYQLQVVRQGRIVSFQMDGTIDDLVAYFAENLEAVGWEQTNSPDTNVGSVASMLRRNEAGDQMSITMQANELGGFVRVTVSVNRSQ